MLRWLAKLFPKRVKEEKYPDILNVVNRKVNIEIRYKTDIENYGKSDVWVKNPQNLFGDCEDYALTKADLLIEYGIPSKDLDIQICFYRDRRRQRVAHAVLVYKGEWVLDNLSPFITRKKDTRYFDWIENEGQRKIFYGTYSG